MYDTEGVLETLDAVFNEVQRQEFLWGVQTHPDGTGGAEPKRQATNARNRCEERFKAGEGTYADILREEFFEALAATPNSQDLIEELVQVSAVCVSWVRAIKNR